MSKLLLVTKQKNFKQILSSPYLEQTNHYKNKVKQARITKKIFFLKYLIFKQTFYNI